MNRSNQGQKAAVAISYDPEDTGAPKVLAAGLGEIARRILDIARQEHVYIHQNATLANLLARVPNGSDIPENAYRLIAELLAFLYATDERLAEKLVVSKRKYLPTEKDSGV
ncbi:MAG: EscU/YscU/HrcU family type III secretion system export apparatus switch protein [Mariprofundaceae bacterium]